MKLLTCIFILIATQLIAAEPYINGEIRFPAKKLFNQTEGTFEVWFKQELALDDKSFKLGQPSSRSLCCFFKVSKTGLKDANRKRGAQNFHFIHHGIFTDGQRFVLGGSFNMENAQVGRAMKLLKLDQDKWHYAAVTWKELSAGKFRIVSYVNGASIRKSEASYRKKDKLGTDSVIYIGDAATYHEKLDSGSLATLDSFRISNKELSAEEISKSFESGKFTAEKTTLLMDDFNKLKTPRKAKIGVLTEVGKTAHKQTQRGLIYGSCKIVEGRNGTKAIQLFQKK